MFSEFFLNLQIVGKAFTIIPRLEDQVFKEENWLVYNFLKHYYFTY